MYQAVTYEIIMSSHFCLLFCEFRIEFVAISMDFFFALPAFRRPQYSVEIKFKCLIS